MLATVFFATALAAASPGTPLTLDQAVDRALQQHPALRASAADEAVSRARAERASAAELPHADASVEAVAGTGNVVRGPQYALREVPAVSGPPLPASFGDASLGSTIAVGAGWDVLALRQRIAETDAALLEHDRAAADTAALRLRIAFGAADAFIAAQAADEGVQVAQAGVDRAQVLATAVSTLAKSELRPGADAARAEAELAVARTQLARAKQAAATSRARLAEALGSADELFSPVAGGLAQLPGTATANANAEHPQLVAADKAVAAAEGGAHAVGLQFWPRLEVVASLWLRGSGLSTAAVGPSPAAGLAPNTPNWAAGAVLSLPLLDLASIRAQEHEANARLESSRWHRAEIDEEVRAQLSIARAGLDAAAEAARNAAVARDAARTAEAQASAQYKAGLGSIVEVAEAQRLLAQAEGDEVVARLSLWRARLDVAAAQGDLAPFLADVRGGS